MIVFDELRETKKLTYINQFIIALKISLSQINI